MRNTKNKISLAVLVDCLKDLEGGAERQIFELSRGLDKEKYKVTIISLECEGKAPRGTIESAGCQLAVFPVKRVYGLSGFLEGFRFLRFLKKGRVDVLMTYHFSSDIWGAFWGQWAGVKTIISNRRDMGFWRTKRHVLAYKFVNRWVSKIIVNARSIKEMVMATEAVPEEKIEVIYNGIEILDAPRTTHNAQRQDFGILPDDIVIMHVANLRPVKGHKYLIEAMAGVVHERPNAKLVLIGEGELDQELKAQADRLGIKENVHFLGKRENARELLDMADICVLTSLSEGMSNAIMEYMAAAKPVVATNVGGNPELVEDGVNGLLVKKEDAESLKAALLSLIKDEEKSAAMGQKGLEKVAREFSGEKMIEKYENIFRSLTPQKNKVLHLISSGGFFGAESVVLTLGQNIQDDRFTSVIGALKDSRNDDKVALIEKAKESGIETCLIPCGGRFDMGAIFRLKKYLKQKQIDILHTHNYKSDIVGALAAWGTGTPIIATAHGFTDMTSSVSFYERLDRLFLKVFFKKIVTVTDKLLPGFSPEKRPVIANGIDVRKFARDEGKRAELRKKLNISEADILIGAVGRLSREKNQKMFLEALYPLMRENELIKAVIVGSGPKEAELKQFVEARHLAERVIFTGLMKDTVAAYSAMDIFVLSSLTEGVPLTVLEAMACKVPVIATRVGGVPEIIHDGETGLLIDRQDADALRARITELIDDKNKRQRFAESAYEFVKENYSLEKMCNAYREVYQEVLV